ncbi:hypothetical protein ACFFGH_10715 [Lysobacter korlensis]|uniref:Uncharacterized protein n=1 Tax=Lysobacter korlensis TaxID=553636 RepID=A0ABV6RPI4_9GAMM
MTTSTPSDGLDDFQRCVLWAIWEYNLDGHGKNSQSDNARLVSLLGKVVDRKLFSQRQPWSLRGRSVSATLASLEKLGFLESVDDRTLLTAKGFTAILDMDEQFS